MTLIVKASIDPEANDLSDNSMTLDRGGGQALWRQIADVLRGEVSGGIHRPGTRLPPEADLAQRFGVNRHTLRRAMEALASEGLIRIEQGRGSFVTEEVLDYPLGSRTRFSEIIRAQQRVPAGRLLRLESVEAPPRIAELLEIRRGAQVILAERLALADGRPVLVGAHHFPLARFPRLLQHLRADPSITAALAASGVGDYTRRVTRITARLPTGEEAAVLEQPRQRPVLLSEALNVDREGRPVDATLTCYAAGRTQLVVESG
ncbi:MAG TPA: phosphonate metabolism transcriptional regulator PhnF [Roseococcus sp.]|jgi:GntR family phosphonate transport system transcriptional regulator|nr:phosphonate metabolism transcriptional regulator PhnF [Roseococcus sp.]